MAGGGIIHVATILGAHGIKGEVKVKSLTGDPKAFATYGALSAADGRSFTVTRLKPSKEGFICTLAGVADRNAAEALRGVELSVPREKLPPLKPGEFYLSDVQGKEAVAGGQRLGRIVGFQNFGAGELLELEGGLLIPVTFITATGDEVTLDLPEGYLNDEAPPKP